MFIYFFRLFLHVAFKPDNPDAHFQKIIHFTPIKTKRYIYARISERRKRFSKKVIDKKSGRIYNSVTEAAKEIGLSRAYLSSQLLGIENKKHHLEYLVD